MLLHKEIVCPFLKNDLLGSEMLQNFSYHILQEIIAEDLLQHVHEMEETRATSLTLKVYEHFEFQKIIEQLITSCKIKHYS